jgi:chromosome segregation ATPase
MGFNFSKLSQVQQELENARRTPTTHNSITEPDKAPPDHPSEDDLSDTEHKNRRRNSLDKFQRDLMEKRRKRQDALASVRTELTTLRTQLEEQSAVNDQLTAILLANGLQVPDTLPPQIQLEKSTTEMMDKQTNTDSRVAEPTESDEREVTEPPRNLRIELAVVHHDLQMANDTILDLQTELNSTKTFAASLKDVISVSKQMVQVREDQLNEVSAQNGLINSLKYIRNMRVNVDLKHKMVWEMTDGI